MKILRPKNDPATAPPVPSPEPAPTPEARKRPLVPPRAPSSAKTRNKVLLSVADGKIEWDKMSSESRRAFEDMFRDPEFLKQFGLTGKENFDPEQMKAIYDGISMIYQTVCAMFLRWPKAALSMLVYSEEQKNMLKGPTAKLADRFAPRLLKDNSELIIFFSIFGAVTQKNFLAASAEAKKLMQQKPPAIQSAPPGPVRVPAPGPAPADRPAPDFVVPFVPPSAAEMLHQEMGESLG